MRHCVTVSIKTDPEWDVTVVEAGGAERFGLVVNQFGGEVKIDAFGGKAGREAPLHLETRVEPRSPLYPRKCGQSNLRGKAYTARTLVLS